MNEAFWEFCSQYGRGQQMAAPGLIIPVFRPEALPRHRPLAFRDLGHPPGENRAPDPAESALVSSPSGSKETNQF